MKKLLGIVVLGLFLSSNAYAFNYLFDLGLSSPGDLDDEIEVDITEDDNNRQLTVKILNQVLN